MAAGAEPEDDLARLALDSTIDDGGNGNEEDEGAWEDIGEPDDDGAWDDQGVYEYTDDAGQAGHDDIAHATESESPTVPADHEYASGGADVGRHSASALDVSLAASAATVDETVVAGESWGVSSPPAPVAAGELTRPKTVLDLPTSALVAVFCALPLRDRVRCEAVCQVFYVALMSASPWRELDLSVVLEPGPHTPGRPPPVCLPAARGLIVRGAGAEGAPGCPHLTLTFGRGYSLRSVESARALFAACFHLRSVDIVGAPVSPAWAAALLTELPALETLRVSLVAKSLLPRDAEELVAVARDPRLQLSSLAATIAPDWAAAPTMGPAVFAADLLARVRCPDVTISGRVDPLQPTQWTRPRHVDRARGLVEDAAAAMRDNHTLRRVAILGGGMNGAAWGPPLLDMLSSPCCTLHDLDLRGMWMPTRDAYDALAEGLRHNSRLESLAVSASSGCMAASCLRGFAEALQSNHTLRSLTLEVAAPGAVQPEAVGADDGVVAAMLEAGLAANGTLRDLRLGGLVFSETMWAGLLVGLSRNDGLQSLQLTHFRRGAPLEAVVAAVRTHRRLRRLVLGTTLFPSQLAVVAEQLRSNVTLREMAAQADALSGPGLDAWEATLGVNRTLQVLSLRLSGAGQGLPAESVRHALLAASRANPRPRMAPLEVFVEECAPTPGALPALGVPLVTAASIAAIGGGASPPIGMGPPPAMLSPSPMTSPPPKQSTPVPMAAPPHRSPSAPHAPVGQSPALTSASPPPPRPMHGGCPLSVSSHWTASVGCWAIRRWEVRLWRPHHRPRLGLSPPPVTVLAHHAPDGPAHLPARREGQNL